MPMKGRERLALCGLLALLLLVSGCTSPAAPAPPAPVATEPPPPQPQPPTLTPARILERMAETHANCRSYRDSGRSTSKVSAGPGDLVTFKPFQTAFARPDQFRFAATYQMPLVHMAWIVWSHGTAVRSWDWHDGHQK